MKRNFTGLTKLARPLTKHDAAAALFILGNASLMFLPWIEYAKNKYDIHRVKKLNKEDDSEMDIKLKPHVLNEWSIDKTPVFTNEDAVLNTFFPGYEKYPFFRRWRAKRWAKRQMHDAHYTPDLGSVFIKLKDGDIMSKRLLGHELGHATDHEEGKLNMKRRSLLHPSNWYNVIFDPDKTSLVQDEIRAWDNAGVPEDDPMRRHALATYKDKARHFRKMVMLGVAPLVAGLLLGADPEKDRVRLKVNKKFNFVI